MVFSTTVARAIAIANEMKATEHLRVISSITADVPQMTTARSQLSLFLYLSSFSFGASSMIRVSIQSRFHDYPDSFPSSDFQDFSH